MLKKLAATGVLSLAAFGIALAASPAHADVHTSGAGGVLAGNQVIVPIAIPVNVCGNAVAVLGHAGAGCKGGAAVVRPGKPTHPRPPKPHHPPKARPDCPPSPCPR